MPRAEGQRKHPQLNARPPALASAAEQLAAGWMDGWTEIPSAALYQPYAEGRLSQS